MSKSKNHHYIPQWLMKFWADSNEKVRVVDRRKSPEVRAYTPNVRNVNSQNYLYSIKDDNGEYDDSLERNLYSPLDNEAHKLTLEIIDILKSGKIPDLEVNARSQFWQFHFYNAVKRYPNSFDKYMEDADIETLVEEEVKLSIQNGENPIEVSAPNNIQKIKSRIQALGVRYARADQNTEVLEHFSKMGIIFGIAPEGTSFVLPDKAFNLQNANDSNNHEKSIWIPIHPSYAVSMSGFDGKCSLKHLSKSQVRKINEEWYSYSNTIISTSEELLKSLVKRHEGKKITFT